MQPFLALRAHAHTFAFILKVLPMLPSGPIDRLSATPVTERVRYPTRDGEVAADLYRPPGRGPHPALVLCLGVVPFGVDHPQIPRLCDALARAGFIALIHWSPAMRDRRLVPEDSDDIAYAYDWLLARSDVDPSRSGLFGTCVGGSFALLAAAHTLIRDRVAFVGAFAPYSSLWTLARDILSHRRPDTDSIAPWVVDPLTRDVFARTVEDLLDPRDATALFASTDPEAVDAALMRLPAAARAKFDAMSPLCHLADIHAPTIMFGHDRDDLVIPVGESRRMARALAGRIGARYTEYAMFQHADPTKRDLAPLSLARELTRFYSSLYPMFRQAA